MGAKLVQIEQKAKFNLSFFEMPPNFDLYLKVRVQKNYSDFLTNLFTLSSTIRKYFRFILSFR